MLDKGNSDKVAIKPSMYSHMTVQLYNVVITIPGVHKLANLDVTLTDRLTTSTRHDND